MSVRFVSAHGLAAALALAIAPAVIAGEPAGKVPRLLSHDELQKRLGDANIRLLDARAKADFDKGHILGARWVDRTAFQDVSRPENFANREVWDQILAPLAISPDSEVYVYDDARQHDAARIWWLLSYAGVERVGLVDGGFSL
jgi:thiosulfate/3-mercaptopyruvate sulfurtransferase